MEAEDVVIEEPKYISFLKREGYEIETTVPFESDSVSQSKDTRYGANKCLKNGVPKVTITKTGDRFSITIVGQAKQYWCSPVIYDLTEEYLVRYGRELEMRVTDAWRELSA